MILPIFLYGQPSLRKEAEEIKKDDPALVGLIANMFETMYNAEGVGLAAPQVGLSIQLFVIDADVLSEDFIECKNLKRVMINPTIVEKSDDETSLDEGCLSFPGIHEKVARANRIRIKYVDEHFNACEEVFEHFAARVVQHEYEHLKGGVFIDHISPIRRQLNKGKLNSILKGTVHCSYRAKAVGK